MKRSNKLTKWKKGQKSLARKEAISAYLCLLPNFIGFLVFTGIPVIMGLVISFTNYDGFSKMDFVGFDNYIKMFKDSQFMVALENNLIYAFAVVPLTLLFSLLLALALNKKIAMGGFFKTVYFFPSLTSMVAIGIIAMMVFQPTGGIVNQMLLGLGIPAEKLPKWFHSTDTALLTVILVVVWKQAGYYMIMFMGGLKNIPEHLYETALIDGANRWQIFKNVTWPMLSPTTFMVTILCFISSFQIFDIIQITTEGGPGRATSVLVFRIYREAFRDWNMGYGSAIAYFLFLIIFIVTLIQWRGQKKWVND